MRRTARQMPPCASSYLMILHAVRFYLDPKGPTFFKDLYKEIIVRYPKKGRFFWGLYTEIIVRYPKKGRFFWGLYTEIIVRYPKKGRFFWGPL